MGCGPQGDQKSKACWHGWGEGPREHVPVQPAPDEVRRAAENLLVRCRACVDMEGGHFEHVLKKYKNGALEE